MTEQWNGNCSVTFAHLTWQKLRMESINRGAVKLWHAVEHHTIIKIMTYKDIHDALGKILILSTILCTAYA